MKKRLAVLLIALLALILLVIYILNTIHFNFNFDLYYENHIVQKGESTLYKYYQENYCFSDNEKQMISNRFKILNVFNNEIFQISDCGDLRISFDVKDYDATGNIYLYSNSSFKDLKEWLEASSYKADINFYKDWISISDSEGEIRFFENEDNITFRMVYITKIPYKYKIKEINGFSPFIKYFLELNEKNID